MGLFYLFNGKIIFKIALSPITGLDANINYIAIVLLMTCSFFIFLNVIGDFKKGFDERTDNLIKTKEFI